MKLVCITSDVTMAIRTVPDFITPVTSPRPGWVLAVTEVAPADTREVASVVGRSKRPVPLAVKLHPALSPPGDRPDHQGSRFRTLR